MIDRTIICISDKGYKIGFTSRFPYFLDKVEGVYETSGEIISSSSANSIGENYQGTHIPKRSITIIGYMQRDTGRDLRQNLYRSFPRRTFGEYHHYEGEIQRKIRYQVESVKIVPSGIYHKFMINLICMNPNFTDFEFTDVSIGRWKALFHFDLIIPFDEGFMFGEKSESKIEVIENPTEFDWGLKVVLEAHDVVTNPYIHCIETGQRLTINRIMPFGEVIEVTTGLHNKNIKQITPTGFNYRNNWLTHDSVFLQVGYGVNSFRVGAEDNENQLSADISYMREYGAV